MTGMRTSLVVLAIAAAATSMLVQAQAGAGSRVTPETVGLSSSRLEEATRLLKRYVKEQKIAGAVAAVARKGRLAYLEAVGLQDIAARSAMTDRTLFRIYSMSKSVTAVAAMMLQE